MNKTALIIFAKEPQPGRVKTRLAQETSPEKAAELYKKMVKKVVGSALKVKCDAQFLYYTADGESIPFLKTFDETLTLRRQEGPDLGARMAHAFEQCFGQGFDRAVLIGTDCVTMTAHDMEKALATLQTCDCVLGPSADGGYYLIGLKECVPELFHGIDWGTSSVLKQTILKTGEHRLVTFLLRERGDIDTLADWKRYQSSSSRA